MLSKSAVRSSRPRVASRKRPLKSSFKQPVSRQVLETLVAGVTNPRDRAIILFLMETGLRSGEFVQLDRDMIKVSAEAPPAGGTEMVATGNLPVESSIGCRSFYLSARALEALNLYLGSRQDTNPALFITTSGERLRVDHVRRLVRAWCHQLDIRPFPLHDFRRRLAADLMASGCNLTIVQSVLGHSDVKRTIDLYSSLNSKAK